MIEYNSALSELRKRSIPAKKLKVLVFFLYSPVACLRMLLLMVWVGTAFFVKETSVSVKGNSSMHIFRRTAKMEGWTCKSQEIAAKKVRCDIYTGTMNMPEEIA